MASKTEYSYEVVFSIYGRQQHFSPRRPLSYPNNADKTYALYATASWIEEEGLKPQLPTTGISFPPSMLWRKTPACYKRLDSWITITEADFSQLSERIMRQWEMEQSQRRSEARVGKQPFEGLLE